MGALDLQAQSVPEAPLVLPDLRVKTVSLDPLDLPALRVLLDLRGMLVNVDPLDLPALRVLLDLLVAELVELPFLDPRVMLVLRVLPDQRVILARPVLPGPLDQLAQQANVVLPDRMQSLLSSISTSPRLRRLRLMVRRQMSKTHSDRRTRLRMVPGTTHQ